MATTHITEAKAARDLAGILARVRAGEEIMIQSEVGPGVLMRPSTLFPTRSLSESIAMSEARAEELRYEPVMDAEFCGGHGRDHSQSEAE